MANQPSTNQFPLSPMRQSRIQERVELQNLNSRLADFIDDRRLLVTENARLNDLVETKDLEAANAKHAYEEMLSTKSNSLEELALEKAQLELNVKQLLDEKEEWKLKLDRKNKEIKDLQEALLSLKHKYSDSTNKHNVIVADHKKTLSDVENLKLELGKVRKELHDCRVSLQKETECRIHLESTNAALKSKEEVDEKLRNVELSVSETVNSRQADVSDINDKYNVKLREGLEQLRVEYEKKMISNREEIESLFYANVENSLMTAQRENQTLSIALECLGSRIDSINGRNDELEQMNKSLNDRIHDLEFTLSGEIARNADIADEASRLRDEMNVQLVKYQDLMDTKVSLELEIATYGQLIGCEDYRSNMESSLSNASDLSQSFLHSVRGSPAPKRSRIETSQSTEDDARPKFFKRCDIM